MEYICQTPVLLIFFNRPDTFRQVFERVKQVKPKYLILAQDGARNKKDEQGIAECRKIAEEVTWDCEITRDYAETNLGCGYRPQSAISMALNKYEKVIILEDDVIPSISFFRYCEELLTRYENDDRIAYISGLNHFETWDCGNYDYFFSRAASIGAWATWKRTWEKYYDYYVEGINDDYLLKLYKYQIGNADAYEGRVAALRTANKSKYSKDKLSFWDTQWGFAEFTQNMLAVVPRKNMICNIGVGELSTHASEIKKNKFVKYKNIVFMPTYEMTFPLRHPNFCACDLEYHNKVYKCFGRGILARIANKIYRCLKRK
jgi:hypothetical protein